MRIRNRGGPPARPVPRAYGWFAAALLLGVAVAPIAGCGGGGADSGGGRPDSASRGAPGSKGRGGGMPAGGPSGRSGAAAVPVEIASVVRRSISSYIETNGTLEAENEVDVVARTSGPIVELGVEEGDRVRRGQLLARIDDQEYRAQFDIARVNLNETRLAFERAKTLQAESLISPENYEQALAAFETAEAQMESSRIQLAYTEIKAPFDGLVIRRYVNFAEQVASNTALYRISDFDPLLCPIQVPERELPALHLGQEARLTFEPFPEERFEASVLRISPVVDAASGTVKVTLEVQSRRKLRPGMFARVFLETATRPDALVIPKSALSLESIGDTIYVADGSVASRREVELGFTEGDFVQVVSGAAEGESVVVVGQDGLSDGTPIQVLRADGRPTQGDAPTADATPRQTPAAGGKPTSQPPSDRGGRPDFSTMTPEQLEQVKQRMRSRGMSEEQIEERLRRAQERSAGG